jgi:hypothetical protein
MELDLQSSMLYSLAETPQPPHPLPPHLGSYTRALLVSQNRRHLFATPWGKQCSTTDCSTVTTVRIKAQNILIQQKIYHQMIIRQIQSRATFLVSRGHIHRMAHKLAYAHCGCPLPHPLGGQELY